MLNKRGVDHGRAGEHTYNLFVCLHLSRPLHLTLQKDKYSPTQPFEPFEPFLRGKVWAQNRLNRLNPLLGGTPEKRGFKVSKKNSPSLKTIEFQRCPNTPRWVQTLSDGRCLYLCLRFICMYICAYTYAPRPQFCHRINKA